MWGRVGSRESGPVAGPSAELVVHRVGQFLEGAFEWEWLPTFAAIERQPVGTGAQRRKSKPGIGAGLVGTANDEMASAGNYVQAARDLARVEHRLQCGHDRRQPRNVGTPTWSRHVASVPIMIETAQLLTRDYRADRLAG